MKLTQIAEILKLDEKILNDIDIKGLSSLKYAGSNELSYCDGSDKAQKFLEDSKAGAILITKELLNKMPPNSIPLVCENPHLNFAILSKFFAKKLIRDSKENLIDKSAKIMPNVYIGNGVKIGKNTIIMPNSFIGDNVSIGDDCIIHPGVVIYNDTLIGNRCHLLANCVIGSDGFGYAHTKEGTHVKIYHNGNVILEDDVEIGACTTIDRGVFEPTIIRKCTKIDNLVQIAHNCDLGENCLIVSQVGLAGSTILGKNVTIGGQAGSGGHLSVGDFAQIAARTGISKDLAGFRAYAGHPIMDLKEWYKLQAKIIRFFKDKH